MWRDIPKADLHFDGKQGTGEIGVSFGGAKDAVGCAPVRKGRMVNAMA